MSAKEVVQKIAASGGKMTTMQAVGAGRPDSAWDRPTSQAELPTIAPVAPIRKPFTSIYRHDGKPGQPE